MQARLSPALSALGRLPDDRSCGDRAPYRLQFGGDWPQIAGVASIPSGPKTTVGGGVRVLDSAFTAEPTCGLFRVA